MSQKRPHTTAHSAASYIIFEPVGLGSECYITVNAVFSRLDYSRAIRVSFLRQPFLGERLFVTRLNPFRTFIHMDDALARNGT